MNNSFYSLSPDTVLNSVEEALNQHLKNTRATGKIFALNSLENRVFEIEFESEIANEKSVVAKFYRPGRWSKQQILEEHAFIEELREAEVPAVAPLVPLCSTDDGIFFTVFPKIRGRLKDELNDEELRQVGRLLGRMHSVGERSKSQHRLTLDLKTHGLTPLKLIQSSSLIEENFSQRYTQICEDFFSLAATRIEDISTIRVHGDCHSGNILWNERGPFFVDFDDMLTAPPVQDIWMIIKGRDPADVKMREDLLNAYEEIKDFDRSSLSLIEVLRGLRMIHYSAWIVKRWEDPCFPQMFQHFGTPKYWSEEIQALDEVNNILRGY